MVETDSAFNVELRKAVRREAGLLIRAERVTDTPKPKRDKRGARCSTLGLVNCKDVSSDELAEAIRAAFAGRPTLAPEATQALIQVACSASEGPEPGYDLTAREREVPALMVEGLNNPQIGARLGISVTTVRTHVSNILSKLGVSNRAEAIALALRNKSAT